MKFSPSWVLILSSRHGLAFFAVNCSALASGKEGQQVQDSFLNALAREQKAFAGTLLRVEQNGGWDGSVLNCAHK